MEESLSRFSSESETLSWNGGNESEEQNEEFFKLNYSFILLQFSAPKNDAQKVLCPVRRLCQERDEK